MAKIVSSYCTKVIGENRIFKDTIRVYRDALSLLIRIVESEWDTGHPHPASAVFLLDRPAQAGAL